MAMFDNISWLLGYYLDGWADLIEGMGAHAAAVHDKVINQLNKRGMPDIEVEETDIQEGFLSDLHRSYVTTKTYPGARTIIYIEDHGNDLYTSWRSFIRPTINWRLILYYALAALGVSCIIAGILYLISIAGVINMVFSVWNSHPFSVAFWVWILIGGAIAIGMIILVFIIGKINKNNSDFQLSWKWVGVSLFSGLILSFSIKNSGQTMINEIITLNSTIKASMQFILVTFSILPVGLNIFAGILILAAIVGLIIRRNILAFILKEPSIFDADDITAMNLSVHKSILRVLDEEGIDISKLRMKREFKGGRSGEPV